ncbi:MAG TPA: metallophosphoesterase, partial [Chthoniobacterales bacterium]
MDPSDAPGRTDYRALRDRMGADPFRRRIEKQAGIWARETHQGRGIFYLERFVPMDEILARCLRGSGLAGWGRRNMLDLELVRREAIFPHLPPEWDGFRLLQLADLHLDLAPELTPRILEKLRGVEFDQAVLVGDYHNRIGTEAKVSLGEMRKLIPALGPKPLGILGNHDFIEKVSFLEHCGLRILLNETVALERGGSRLWVAGVDDPHFFRTHDLEAARRPIPPGEFSILLSHSPETYREAAALGFDFMLSGHTHGGQICLPGGWPIIRNADVPRRLLSGPWREGKMQGYTSRGTGACGVAARFFCRPEITLHTLRRELGANPDMVGGQSIETGKPAPAGQAIPLVRPRSSDLNRRT